MSKVLFVTYDGLTDPLGQSQILPYMSGLSKRGHQIHILSCDKRDNYQLHHKQIEEECERNNIKWISIPYQNKWPVISPYSNSKNLKKKVKELNKLHHYDIVHCRSIIPALCASPLQEEGVKLIFDIRGFWADERVEGKIWNMNIPIYRYLYKYFKKKEKQLFENAEAIVTLTHNAKNYISKHFKSKELFGVVPCTVDLNHFKRRKEEQCINREDLNLNKEDIVFCYSGSLGTRYLTSELLDCFQEISRKYSQAKLLFITKSDTANLNEELRKRNLSTRTVITSCNYADIPSYIQLCDIAIYFIYSGFSGKAVSPTKQAEFLSMGVPVIVNSEIGDTEEIIGKEEVGFVIDHFTNEQYEGVANAVSRLKGISQERCRDVAKKYFDLSDGIETYHRIYSNLV